MELNVEHQFSGKNHFYKTTEEGKEHSVAIQFSCDCRFMAIKGIPNGLICRHIKAVLNKIIEKGSPQWK